MSKATFTRQKEGFLPAVYQDYHMDNPHQWEEDGLIVTRTRAFTGPGCHEGCGVLVYSDKEGNFVKVEGDKDFCFNQGRLCPRCLAIDEVMNHPDRIIHPMKRAHDQRGNAEAWERCSWDEALEICHDEFQRIIDTYGAEHIYVWKGTGRDIVWCEGRLAYSMGTPNMFTPFSGNSCYLPRLSQMVLTIGGVITADYAAQYPDRYDNSQYEIPNCTVLWGSNIMNSNTEYQLGGWVTDLMQRGTKIITVDPRLTWIAAHSDIHLPIRPATDTALALSMINVLFEEDLIDHEYVDAWVYGAEEICEAAVEFPPEKAAEICWLDDPELIRAAARMIAEKKPASTLWGVSVDMQANGVCAAMAIEAIFALTGNIDIPGGMHFTQGPGGMLTQMQGGWEMDKILTKEQMDSRIGLDKYPMFRIGVVNAQPDLALEMAEAGFCKGIWMQTNNALCTGQEPERWYKVMKDAEFVAAVDLFMTPSAQCCADVFLPAACWPEKMSLRAMYYDLSTINPAIKPRGEVKSDAEINRLLGRMFNKEAWPWESEKEIYDYMLQVTGFTWDELQANGPAYSTYEYGKNETGKLRFDGEPGFHTPTGKIEVYSTQLEAMGYSPVPYFEEPHMGPVTTPDLFEEYPIVLMTGARNGVFFHSEHRQIDRMRQFNSDPTVEINAKTAAKYGLSSGEWAWIENRHGKIRQKVKVTETMKDDTVLIQHAWWFPEQEASEPNLYGVWKANANSLIPNVPSEFGFGADIKCVLCKMYRAEEGGIE